MRFNFSHIDDDRINTIIAQALLSRTASVDPNTPFALSNEKAPNIVFGVSIEI